MRKQERNVLIASGFGFLLVLGVFAVKKILNIEEYDDQEHNDLIEERTIVDNHMDDQHGVEYFSVL